MSDFITSMIARYASNRGAMRERLRFADYRVVASRLRGLLGVSRLPREVSEAVHQAIARHEARRANRPAPRVTDGRIIRLLDERLSRTAVRVANGYHKRVRSLYQSERACVAVGRGGRDDADYSAYSRSYGFPARWKNAGARVEGGPGHRVIVLETSRGTEVARIPIDPSIIPSIVTNHPALLDGDLWGIQRHGIIERYALRRGKVVRIGVAVQLRRLCARPFGSAEREIVEEWEHGASISECRRESERKVQLREAEWLAAELNQRLRIGDANARRLAMRIDRAARLIARLCNNMTAGYEDARAVGHCDPGIRGWCTLHHVDIGGSATFEQLRGDPQSERVMEFVAKRAAIQIVANRTR